MNAVFVLYPFDRGHVPHFKDSLCLKHARRAPDERFLISAIDDRCPRVFLEILAIAISDGQPREREIWNSLRTLKALIVQIFLAPDCNDAVRHGTAIVKGAQFAEIQNRFVRDGQDSLRMAGVKVDASSASKPL